MHSSKPAFRQRSLQNEAHACSLSTERFELHSVNVPPDSVRQSISQHPSALVASGADSNPHALTIARAIVASNGAGDHRFADQGQCPAIR